MATFTRSSNESTETPKRSMYFPKSSILCAVRVSGEKRACIAVQETSPGRIAPLSRDEAAVRDNAHVLKPQLLRAKARERAQVQPAVLDERLASSKVYGSHAHVAQEAQPALRLGLGEQRPALCRVEAEAAGCVAAPREVKVHFGNRGHGRKETRAQGGAARSRPVPGQSALPQYAPVGLAVEGERLRRRRRGRAREQRAGRNAARAGRTIAPRDARHAARCKARERLAAFSRPPEALVQGLSRWLRLMQEIEAACPEAAPDTALRRGTAGTLSRAHFPRMENWK